MSGIVPATGVKKFSVAKILSLMEDCLKLLGGKTARSSALIEDCLKLLGGGKDCQRLASLLLVTKVCNKDDHSGIQQISLQFFLRPLCTDIVGGRRGKANKGSDAYLELTVAVMAAFCRVSQIAASPRILAVIPLLIQILSTESISSRIEDCYELLYLVANNQEDGARVLYESGGIQMIASNMTTLCLNAIEYAMKLVHLMLSKLPYENIYSKHPTELGVLVVEAARILHTDIKFKALHFLPFILSSIHASPLLETLQSDSSTTVWSSNIKAAVVAILNSPAPSADKLQTLILASNTIYIVGKKWLINPVELPNVTSDQIPANSYIQLFLETLRVEIAVLLNDLAHLRDGTSKNTTTTCPLISFMETSRNLDILFILLKKIIELIGDPDATTIISDNPLEVTVCDVLEYLQYAKEHGQTRGVDLIASVGVIGLYIEKRPNATCKEKVRGLMNYMLSVRGTNEIFPHYSICFMRPWFDKLLVRSDGGEFFISSGALKSFVECITNLIVPGSVPSTISNKFNVGVTFYECGATLANFLLNWAYLRSAELDASLFKLVPTLSRWIQKIDDRILILLASTICVLILSSTFQQTLRCFLDLEKDDLNPLSLLLRNSSIIYADGPDPKSSSYQMVYDLFRRISADCHIWVNKLPSIEGSF